MLFHEQNAQFAQAEDALFLLLEAVPDNRDMLDLAEAFYRRLGALNDDTLAGGGLPRAEVEDGLREILARRARLG
jgi:hypothetical protein